MAKINVEGRELGFYNVIEEDAFVHPGLMLITVWLESDSSQQLDR